MGFAPAATFFEPSRMISCASTVAVVVPSPAISEVLLATQLDLRARVLPDEHVIACLHVQRNRFAVVVDAAAADGDDSVACCGFSLAVSGMMIPPIFCSCASTRLTRTRSRKGRTF